MSDLPERITARVDYDGEWDGQWCEIDREPIGIHAYHHAEYVRADRIATLEAERDAAQARADALAEKLEKATRFVRGFACLAKTQEHGPDEMGLIDLDTLRFQRDCDIVEARATLAAITGETDDHTD